MSDEKEPGFKVSDRRLFNPDGTPRTPDPELEPAPAPAAPAEPQAATGTQAQRTPEVLPGPAFGAEDEMGAGSLEEPEMTEFMEFVMNIATSTAFIPLGLMEHPATGRPQVNLPAAQQGIDLLAMLREKTRGNLTRAEEEFFETLLADLRMQFVSLNGGR